MITIAGPLNDWNERQSERTDLLKDLKSLLGRMHVDSRMSQNLEKCGKHQPISPRPHMTYPALIGTNTPAPPFLRSMEWL
jgi:hypothetical protein